MNTGSSRVEIVVLYVQCFNASSQYICQNPEPAANARQPSNIPSHLLRHRNPLNGVCGPHARTRGGIGCRPHGLYQCQYVRPSSYVSQYSRDCCFAADCNRTWTLDVADDGAGGVVHELNTDLGNTSTGTCKYVRASFLLYIRRRRLAGV